MQNEWLLRKENANRNKLNDLSLNQVSLPFHANSVFGHSTPFVFATHRLQMLIGYEPNDHIFCAKYFNEGTRRQVPQWQLRHVKPLYAWRVPNQVGVARRQP